MELLCIPMGYLIGTVNPSYIIAKIRGEDIRKKGSGNAGASNALIIYGKLIGVFCALFDIFKSFFAIRLAEFFFPTSALVFSMTGVSCILGHVFPFYMGFKGGKGVACLGGMILAYDWLVFLIMLASEIVLVLASGYICLMSISASIVFPFIYGILSRNIWGGIVLLISGVVITWKHRENVRRIGKGTEMRISMLWNKEKEIERVQHNGQEK